MSVNGWRGKSHDEAFIGYIRRIFASDGACLISDDDDGGGYTIYARLDSVYAREKNPQLRVAFCRSSVELAASLGANVISKWNVTCCHVFPRRCYDRQAFVVFQISTYIINREIENLAVQFKRGGCRWTNSRSGKHHSRYKRFIHFRVYERINWSKPLCSDRGDGPFWWTELTDTREYVENLPHHVR